MASFENVVLAYDGATARITMNRPDRRNALSETHLRDLLHAFEEVAATDVAGVVLAGNGPVFRGARLRRRPCP